MLRTDLEARLRTLASHAWDGEVRWPEIEAWIESFTGAVAARDKEQLASLYALSKFIYFGKRQIREMLKALYRDHFEAPLTQRIRRNLNNTRDVSLLKQQFQRELAATRFLGVGNPSESGAHLLYYFRQVNSLKKDLFVDLSGAFAPQIVKQGTSSRVDLEPRNPGASRYIFFDDLVGSGTQASDYLGSQLAAIRRHKADTDLRLLALFATTTGLERMNSKAMFDGKASCLFELDETFKTFSASSRYFVNAPDWFNQNDFLTVASHYGSLLQPSCPLGYKNGQLMMGFSHNTPDNTLPIFWSEGRTLRWAPVFARFSKVY